MSDDSKGAEGLTIEDLAQQMLGNSVEEEEDEPQGHPAWRDILDVVPQEHQSKVREQLASWDAGVSRRFQKIHDEYAPYKALEDYDPEMLKTAADVYSALVNNPQDTWETIGRVYGLSSEGSENEDENDEEDGFVLPNSVKQRLSKLDEHDRILGMVAQDLQRLQAQEQEAQEDRELEEYLEELTEEFGEFDEDYVVGLIASGIDGEEAVARYQQLIGQYQQPQRQYYAPNVMSGSGGIPSSGSVNVSKLNQQDTQNLVAEILRLTAAE